MTMEQAAWELQSCVEQAGIAAEYIIQRVRGCPTSNQQDVSSCMALSQHLQRAQEICLMLVNHSVMEESW